jgi:hypothetical protein
MLLAIQSRTMRLDMIAQGALDSAVYSYICTTTGKGRYSMHDRKGRCPYVLMMNGRGFSSGRSHHLASVAWVIKTESMISRQLKIRAQRTDRDEASTVCSQAYAGGRPCRAHRVFISALLRPRSGGFKLLAISVSISIWYE